MINKNKLIQLAKVLGIVVSSVFIFYFFLAASFSLLRRYFPHILYYAYSDNAMLMPDLRTLIALLILSLVVVTYYLYRLIRSFKVAVFTTLIFLSAFIATYMFLDWAFTFSFTTNMLLDWTFSIPLLVSLSLISWYLYKNLPSEKINREKEEMIKKIKKNKKVYFLILILFLLLIASGSVYYYFFRGPEIQVPADGVLQIKEVSNNLIILGNYCGSKNYVNKNADFIIEGTLEKVDENWNIDYTSHTINAEFYVEKFIKGRSFDVKQINILDIINFSNNTYRDNFRENPNYPGTQGRPNFKEGEKIRLYLVEWQGTLSILCGNYGVEELIEK